jgi:hypothetical protein
VPSNESRLAVDLSGGLIRVVDGAMGGPMRSGSAGAPPGAVVDGRVQDPTAVGVALKQLLARNEIQETRAYVAVSDAVAAFRVLKFPLASTDSDVDSAVTRELSLDPLRMATRWVEVRRTLEVREVYATAWDRALVKRACDAARQGGLDPVVVELKSASVARVVPEPSCVVLDTSSDPMEVFLIAGGVPHVWHCFHADASLGSDLAPALAGPLRSVMRFNKRRRDTEFGPGSPVFIVGEQMLPTQVVASLSEMVEHPVLELPIPTRIPPELRYTTYLTCLGLIMRRTR